MFESAWSLSSLSQRPTLSKVAANERQRERERERGEESVTSKHAKYQEDLERKEREVL